MKDLSKEIINFLNEVQEPVSAAELARLFFKIVSQSGAEGLIRGILAQHPRCEEVEPGLWRSRGAREEPWLPRLVLVPECPPGTESSSWLWHVGALRVTADRADAPLAGSGDSPGVREVLRAARELPLASPRPNHTRRWLDAQERLLGIPEVTGEVLDLRQALRWLLQTRGEATGKPDQLRNPASWSELLGMGVRLGDGMEASLDGCSSLLLACADASPNMRPFKLFLQDAARGTPVDFTPFSFSREDVESIPDVPGVYRFLGKAQQCIYIGKAKNLRQRVLQYFTPISEGSRRRALFLEDVRDLEWIPAHSELSALILEAMQIRRKTPRWNVKIETHQGGGELKETEGALVFAVPSSLESAQYEIYILRPGGAGRLREPLDTQSPPSPDVLGGYLEDFLSGGESPVCETLPFQEAVLVRRWYRSNRDDLLRLRVDHFSSWEAAARALLSALSEWAGGAWVREPPRPGIP